MTTLTLKVTLTGSKLRLGTQSHLWVFTAADGAHGLPELGLTAADEFDPAAFDIAAVNRTLAGRFPSK
ncbi:hypothetical protein QRX60_12245 [Amycolatopsis mongoliensis]|uniref:Uncharacterized protein n=1 Tax=Amycolatopsis mongoliensis TaxID=715475 RepID=A0A9Y2JTR2_9PSEU|nr:hypothetical protein [Amycolatopsis sp. 4-36]WIY04571.1 hypothetical protein QRX60_12245 [Amycolatopsis sp. 4-36]